MIGKYVEGKAAVFIDAANLSKSIESAGYKIYYRKLKEKGKRVIVL